MIKNFFMTSICLLFTLLSFSQNNIESAVPSGLNDFANSIDVSNYISTYQNSGIVDLTASYSLNEEATGKPIYYLAIKSSQNTLIGYLQGALAKANYVRIPNGGKYFMIFRDYTNFNIQTKTGVIKYFDANYDNFYAGEISINNNSVTNWQTSDMPQNISLKYNFNDGDVAGRRHHCDLNHNGDVTFSECYKCMKDACDSNPNCMAQCDLYPTCNGTIRVSCAIVAMFN